MLEVTAYTGLGPGPHDVNVTALSVKTAKAGGDYLRWEFTDAAGKTASANTSKEMTPGNKTGKWYAELTGRQTVVGEQRSLGEPIGKPCTIFIENNAEGYPKVVSLIGRPSSTPSHAPVGETVAKSESGTPRSGDEALSDELPF